MKTLRITIKGCDKVISSDKYCWDFVDGCLKIWKANIMEVAYKQGKRSHVLIPLATIEKMVFTTDEIENREAAQEAATKAASKFLTGE